MGPEEVYHGDGYSVTDAGGRIRSMQLQCDVSLQLWW